MIVEAARQVQSSVLWTEDLNDGQDYGGVVARNPFSETGRKKALKAPR